MMRCSSWSSGHTFTADFRSDSRDLDKTIWFSFKKMYTLWVHPTLSYSSVIQVIHFLGSCFHLRAQGDIPSLRCPLIQFWISWPSPLTYDLDLDILSLDLHTQIQVYMSVRLAGIARWTDTQTHRHIDDVKTITPDTWRMWSVTNTYHVVTLL